MSLGFEMDSIHVSNICTKASITIGFHRRKLYPCLQSKEEGKYKESIQSSTIPPRHLRDNIQWTGASNHDLEIIKGSTQLSTKAQLLIKTKIRKNEEVSYLSDVVFIMLINVKMPTIVNTSGYQIKLFVFKSNET